MIFDIEGHSLLLPLELQREVLAENFRKLINGVFLKATPAIFSREQFYIFCQAAGDSLGIHPNNIIVRGSSLLGYSLKPTGDRLWGNLKADSDIDLAIIDPDYFEVIDRTVQNFDEYMRLRDLPQIELKKYKGRQETRRFNYYRHFDLPAIAIAQSHNETIRQLVDLKLTQNRSVDAFIFRDWWSMFGRWLFELQEIRNGLNEKRLPDASG